MSFFRDLIESTFPAVYAEEPEEEEQPQEEESGEEEPKEEESSEEEPKEEEESSEGGDDEDGDDEDEDDEDEDEDDEDEEEQPDPLDALREECVNSSACKSYNHHFQECVERVTKEMEEPDYDQKDYKEDCVEEFFHLQHCVNDCAAPRLFYKLR